MKGILLAAATTSGLQKQGHIKAERKAPSCQSWWKRVYMAERRHFAVTREPPAF